MEDSVLFVHAHIVIDGNKEVLDGAIAFKDTIEDVYYHLNDKILKKYEGRIYDLKGLIIMPSFVNIGHTEDDGIYDDGVDVRYKDQILIHRTSKDEDYDGLIAPYDSNLKDYDVVLDLFHTHEKFDHQKPTLINDAFNNKSYVSVSIDDIHDDVLGFILRVIDRKKLIITGDLQESDIIKRLKKHNVANTDIVLYRGINLLRLLGYKRSGELKRGMEASFDIYDKGLQLLYRINKGEYLKGESK